MNWKMKIFLMLKHIQLNINNEIPQKVEIESKISLLEIADIDEKRNQDRCS